MSSTASSFLACAAGAWIWLVAGCVDQSVTQTGSLDLETELPPDHLAELAETCPLERPMEDEFVLMNSEQLAALGGWEPTDPNADPMIHTHWDCNVDGQCDNWTHVDPQAAGDAAVFPCAYDVVDKCIEKASGTNPPITCEAKVVSHACGHTAKKAGAECSVHADEPIDCVAKLSGSGDNKKWSCEKTGNVSKKCKS